MTHVQRFRSMGCDIVVGGAAASELRAIEQLFAERDARSAAFAPTAS